MGINPFARLHKHSDTHAQWERLTAEAHTITQAPLADRLTYLRELYDVSLASNLITSEQHAQLVRGLGGKA